MRTTLLRILFLVCVVAPVAHGQGAARLVVNVKDADTGGAIARALVSTQDSSATGSTDSDGRLTLEGLAAGNYVLKATAPGMNSTGGRVNGPETPPSYQPA